MIKVARMGYWTLLAGALLVPWSAPLEAQTPKDAPKEPTVMQRKLQHAQSLLDALALNDFDKLTKNADALLKVREEATWRINETEQYLRYSNAFAEHLNKLKKAAKAKNIDGATLAYLDMTLTCVKCHDHLRVTKGGKRIDD